MFKFASDFFISKTTWTAITAIGTAITAAVQHQITPPAAAAAIFAALFAAFHRDTVAKGNEEAAADRAEMLDHAANAAADAQVNAQTQARLLPGWGSEVGAILDVFAKHFHSNTLNSVAGVIHTLNNLPGVQQAVAEVTGIKGITEPTTTELTTTELTAPATEAPTVVEPVDGEAKP